MRCGMKKPHGLKVRRHANCLIDINEYLALLFGSTLSENFGVTELNEFLSSVTNIWIKQAYLQVFDCESITFRKLVNIFERMEIV